MKLSRIFKILCLFLFSISSFAATAPTVTISVDATSAPRKIFHASLKIPATPGDLTLYYPKWIPGEHAPDGPVVDLAGLKFSAGSTTLKWRRDLLDGFTLHVEVPAGVTEVDADLDYLSPATLESGFSAGSSATDKLAVISWNQVLLYPKGYKSDDINYTASLKLPERWKFGTRSRLRIRPEVKSTSPRCLSLRWSIPRDHRRIFESRPAGARSSHRNGHRRRQRRRA